MVPSSLRHNRPPPSSSVRPYGRLFRNGPPEPRTDGETRSMGVATTPVLDPEGVVETDRGALDNSTVEVGSKSQ